LYASGHYTPHPALEKNPKCPLIRMDLRAGLDVLEKGKIFPLAGFEPQVKILSFRSILRKRGRKNPLCAFLQLEEFGGNAG
jgi:hypothetical protein